MCGASLTFGPLERICEEHLHVPVRIYALAKELKLDSKDLVDLCTRIGIPNKGSALASLEDDEVARIRKYLSGSGTAEASPAAPARPAGNASPSGIGAPIREPSRLPPISSSPPREKEKEKEKDKDKEPVAPVAKAPVTVSPPAAPPAPLARAPQPVAEPTPPPAEPVKPAPAPQPEPVRPAEVDPPRPGITKADYIGPAGSTGKPLRVIGRKAPANAPAKPAVADDRKRTPGQRRDPVINVKLPSMPKGSVVQPAPPKSNEPAPQKPEIRLTPEILAGMSKGGPAPEAPAAKDGQSRRPKVNPLPTPGDRGAPNRTPVPGKGGGLSTIMDKSKGKKGGKGVEDEEEVVRKPVGDVRDERKRRRPSKGVEDSEETDRRRRPDGKTLHRRGTNTAAPRKDKAVLELPCTVRSFSEAAGVSAGKVCFMLQAMGIVANINSNMSSETAHMVALELNVDLDFREPESLEENVINEINAQSDEAEDLVPRPPIVTFLGHVDHGKTSLLDYLIGTRIVAGEAGGITQSIRAYQVDKDGKAISFVDTPGHEAFTEMRARGANVTDIAILVIAAEDGIMPQTEEAISHAKAAKVPIVVAMNKIDLPGADPNRVLTQMTEHGLTPSEWGGDVEVVRTSAITGQGMDELLETLLTIAELNDYRANPNRPAVGVCLESGQVADKGVIAKIVIQNGTLKPGDIVLCGTSHGRVKALYDTLNPSKQLPFAGPSMPVNITGLDAPPAAGERFYVIDDIAKARELAEGRADYTRNQSLSGTSPKVSFETFQNLLQTGKLGKTEEKVVLNLIIRADARGSLEAIEKELGKLDHPEVEVRILQKSVGGITVADVTLASASEAVILGFNVIPDEAARGLADERNVEIRRYDIIYKLAEDIRAILEGRLRPEQKVVELGRALVKAVFNISRVGAVAGCYVAQGTIERGCRIRVNRDGRTIGDYPLDSLKRIKEDVKEVPRGMECGIKLSGFNDLKQDDVLEAYRIEEVARTLGP